MTRSIKPMLLLAATLALAPAARSEDEWRRLFDGATLDGWSVSLEGRAPGEDPEKFVQIRDGSIHMYADADPDLKVPFGVITSKDAFSRFHLSLEYRWGDQKFAPRKQAIRDAGLLYHVLKPSRNRKVWPVSVECQIQEGDTGDLIFIETAGMSWAHPEPEKAPPGQGNPSLLPENGGYLQRAKNGTYFGRFPELDRLEGWNTVEVIVHAGESAEHIVNGKTKARLSHMEDGEGAPLKSGAISLQLEGAEILYRNIRIRALDEPLVADRTVVSLSAVKGKPARTAEFSVANPLDHPLACGLALSGADPGAFTVECPGAMIAAGGKMTFRVTFDPSRGAGRYSAGLRIGDAESGTFVLLQGIGLAAFEGENEPALQTIVRALGIPINVGGDLLKLDLVAPAIGDGMAVPRFRAAGEGKIRVTPLARFSPPGATPLGFVVEGNDELREIARFARSDEAFPDAHQTLFPAFEGGVSQVEFDAPSAPFALYMKGPKFVAFTDPARPAGGKLAHNSRVYPVTDYQGRKLKHSFLVGFEEAANGDYQDGVILIENVIPSP